LKPTSKKKRDAKVQKIRDQIKAGYSGEYGFLHIPKTGGSGVNEYGQALVQRGYKFPCHFGHGWKVEEILTHFPKMKINFILRDPLSRMISGFNSRLRQGRPTYTSIWTPGEASAFTLFPSIKHLLDAILADDEYNKSAVAYTMRCVRHLHWNYAYYFKNMETLESSRSNFSLIGTMDTLDEFIDGVTAQAGAPKSLASELYGKRHESSSKSGNVLDNYSPKEITRIRNFMRRDYKIYSELLSISGRAEA
jgi:hypothetical protein